MGKRLRKKYYKRKKERKGPYMRNLANIRWNKVRNNQANLETKEPVASDNYRTSTPEPTVKVKDEIIDELPVTEISFPFYEFIMKPESPIDMNDDKEITKEIRSNISQTELLEADLDPLEIPIKTEFNDKI